MCIIFLGRLCNIISPGREYEARKLAVGYFAENGIKYILDMSIESKLFVSIYKCLQIKNKNKLYLLQLEHL